MKKKISIIVPVYNEEANISALYTKLYEIIPTFSTIYDHEIIFINDGSTDLSWHLIAQLASTSLSIKAINFSRNFGHQMALTAGYDIATGDAIISIDCDLQDPPTLILEMINQWNNGSEIVYARRINREDSFLKKATAILYYKLLDSVSDVAIPRNVGDFRLVDKKVLTALQGCREKARYLRGIVAWTGFKHSFVDFNRPNRVAGKTGYTWSKMIKLAFDGITGFSLFPLKLAAFAGIFVIATGSLMFAYISVDALFFGIDYPLFKWLVTILYIFMGIQFILLWLIGEYIGRIHEQQKNRPLYITNEIVNISHEKAVGMPLINIEKQTFI